MSCVFHIAHIAYRYIAYIYSTTVMMFLLCIKMLNTKNLERYSN